MSSTPSFSLPLICTQPRDIEELPDADRRLHFTIAPTSGGQPVTRGRFKLKPDICLNDYRCEVVFDWIELFIGLTQSVRACDLGKVVKNRKSWRDDGGVRFLSPDREDNHFGNRFVVRIQDPTLARILEVLRIVNGYRRIDEIDFFKTEIRGLELSVDFYPKSRPGLSQLELALRRTRMSAALRSHFILEPSWAAGEVARDEWMWPRYCDGGSERKIGIIRKRLGRVAKTKRGMSHLLRSSADPRNHVASPINATVYLGSKVSPIYFRLQDKVSNRRRNNSFAEPLPPEKMRARIEVTLRKFDWEEVGMPAAMCLGCVEDVLAANLTKWQQMLFNFQIPTVSMDSSGRPLAEELDVFSKSGAMGLDLYHRAKNELEGRPSLGKKGHSLRYTDLNKMVVRALGSALRRFAKGAVLPIKPAMRAA